MREKNAYSIRKIVWENTMDFLDYVKMCQEDTKETKNAIQENILP